MIFSGTEGNLRVHRWTFVIFSVVVVWGVGVVGEKHHHRGRGHHNNESWGKNGPISTAVGHAKDGELVSKKSDNELVNKGKICIGTNGRMSVPSNKEHHYRNLRDRYTNCTYVDGNLEITWLQDENLDLSFLQYIREVTGYVLISRVDVKRVVLPRLQIIRGRTLFQSITDEEPFALLVTLCQMFTLELPALRDVLNGNIGLLSNYNLCHVQTIDWKEIISGPNGRYVYMYNFTTAERDCPPCHDSCKKGCWGEGAENCQKFSKEYCSPQCSGGRCFGPNPRECCHLFCAGGCNGPKQSDCIACKNFYDDGVCTQECPSMQIYNPTTYSWEPNPNGKYAYGATCVKNCPEHLLRDNGACVRSCPINKKYVNGECVPCDGPCPKTCVGNTLIHSGNIDTFKGCTIIEGYIHILENSFKGFQHIYQNYTFGERYPPMHPDRLEVFSTLKEITGFIDVQASHPDFKNLSYFRNLEVIGGRNTHEFASSLFIVKTSLQSLGLRSLKRINSGSIAILENNHLCFAENINWSKILQKYKDQSQVLSNNSSPTRCKAEGLVCDEQCSRDGCWGAGNNECLSCANYRLGSTCIQNCTVRPGLYRTENSQCKECDEQCLACIGPGPEKCLSCRHVKDGHRCVTECPMNKYYEKGECQDCHQNCVDGCTGSKNTVGLGGCNSCHKAILNENATVDVCLQKDEACPDGYFFEWVRPQDQEFLKPLAGKAICRKCHPRCKKCTGYGFHMLNCQQCTNYRKGEQCEDECLMDHYPDDSTQECLPCHEECKGCTGPGPENCISCEKLKVFQDGDPANNGSFICATTCPPEYPKRVFSQYNSESYCTVESALESIGALPPNTPVIIIYVVVSAFILFGIGLILSICYYCKKVKVKENTLKMTLALTGLEDNEPLRPSNVLPNVAQLRIIKETEMRRGGILGYGAFGTVYKGVWVPEGESTKIPVAIKVLREDTGANSSKEFLGEAYIMASVDHPNLLQLLAVCMTSQMMLVTQLMPLGCLLDFVRKNHDKIGSKSLLNWCTQIARGMAYLEEKRLVHRDLAARNVLVQTPACVKITDFGLAKLLDINEEEYKAAGGKMPIKWLALECIQHRIFTHKSDVWAFGVTVWELLTYGGRPYDNVPAREVPELLEKGERLPQPTICSIDVYMIMIKCWMLDAESRPGFKELADDFSKMARDPGRYLAIPGDQFMRLPNFSTQDDREGPRTTMSSIENSEMQSEGDEYLQPKSRAPLPPSTLSSISSVSPPPTPVKFWPSGSQMTSDGSCAPQNQHNWNQERLRYAQSHGLDPNSMKSMSTSDGSSTRYCGDPIKSRSDMGSDEYDSGRAQAQVGTLKLELPVDEDDYLMPSPQQSQVGTTYVDLIDSKNGSNPNIYRNYEFYKTNIDNPEYLMGDGPSQTLGIPTVSELVQASTSNNGDNVTATQPPRSSEEESDHEYYNDFDRLQRELQPLQRKGGETTV